MTPFGAAPAFRLSVDVEPPCALDPATMGPVRLVRITGGRVEGGIAGHIVPGGTDWQSVAEQGLTLIELLLSLAILAILTGFPTTFAQHRFLRRNRRASFAERVHGGGRSSRHGEDP